MSQFPADYRAIEVGEGARRAGSAAELARQLDTIRFEAIPGLMEQHACEPVAWGALLMAHPAACRLLLDPADEMVGFWHLVSLSAETYRRVRAGELVTTDLRLEMTCPLEPGVHDVYLASCCLRARCRGLHAGTILLHSFWASLLELARRQVWLREICTNAFTPHGIIMARGAGLTWVGTHRISGQIFAAEMGSLLNRSRVRPAAVRSGLLLRPSP